MRNPSSSWDTVHTQIAKGKCSAFLQSVTRFVRMRLRAIRLLHEAGIRKVVMLSGDNTRTAKAIAKQAGIDEAQGDLLPEQKIEEVRKLAANFGRVGMIGDGVNDAPALAAANVGIAMGAGGTDTAIETADVALMRDDLMMVSEAIRLGRRTLGHHPIQHYFRPWH